jgi:hypothetical protein
MRGSVRNPVRMWRVGSRGLAIALLAISASGCHQAGKGASGVTGEEDRQLDQVAADLDANTVDTNAVAANATTSDGDQSQ